MARKTRFHLIKQFEQPAQHAFESRFAVDFDEVQFETGHSSIVDLYNEILDNLNMHLVGPPEDWRIIAESVTRLTDTPSY